jgi:hypothetical protein
LNAISTGGGGTRLDVSLTLDDSGNRFNGSVSADGKQAYLWSGARINGGVSAGGGTVQRQLAPIVPEQQDKTRFGGVSLEQMLDGLFNRRTAD